MLRLWKRMDNTHLTKQIFFCGSTLNVETISHMKFGRHR